MKRFLRWFGSIALVVALGAPLLAQDGPVSLTFSKENPDGDGIWIGTVGGGLDGSLQTILLNADTDQPVWLVAFEGVVDAGEGSFRAHVGGTLDTTTGQVRMHGVVTSGFMLGAAVEWQGQMVDEEASRFEGTIVLTPAQAATD